MQERERLLYLCWLSLLNKVQRIKMLQSKNEFLGNGRAGNVLIYMLSPGVHMAHIMTGRPRGNYIVNKLTWNLCSENQRCD